MKTVTICGSMKFAKQMKEIAWRLETTQAYNVLQCAYNENNEAVSETIIHQLSKAHYKKIEISDAIYVVNVDGYIGNSVQGEIQYAKELGKEIIYHVSIK